MATSTRSKTSKKPEPEQATPEAEPLLDLTGAVKRPTVRLKDPSSETGGRICEIRLISDFGLRDQQMLHRDGKEFQSLWDAEEELDDAESDRLSFLLDRMFEKVLDAPKAIREKLNAAERAQVVLTFRIAPLAQAAAQSTGS